MHCLAVKANTELDIHRPLVFRRFCDLSILWLQSLLWPKSICPGPSGHKKTQFISGLEKNLSLHKTNSWNGQGLFLDGEPNRILC